MEDPARTVPPLAPAAGARALLARTPRPAPGVAGLVVYAALIGLRAVLDDPGVGASFLLAIPIALVTVSAGRTAGYLLALTALLTITVQSEMTGNELPVGGYVTRGILLLAIPALVVWIDSRRASGPAAEPGSAQVPDVPRLTPRERDVLRLIALGHTNAEIARELVLSVRTIESHRARIQHKLRRHGRAELVRYAMQHGLLADDAEPAAQSA